MDETEGAAEQVTDADDVMEQPSNVIPFLPPHVIEMKKRLAQLRMMADLPNVASVLDDDELHDIGSKAKREFDLDTASRKDWEARAKRAMDAAKQIKQAKSFPWDDASNVAYPLMTTAALQFAARAYPAIVDGPRVVKCQVMGADPDGSKAGAADRISQHMSYQLLFETNWEADVDTMLHQLPIIGNVFKKVFRDGTKEAGFCDDLISAFDLVVNQAAKDIEIVPRITHVFPLYPHQIAERQRSGTYLDAELDGDAETAEDDQSPHQILEQHRYLDLDDDGIEEPWIVTVHEKTQKVLRIVACFDPDEIEVDAERGKILRIKRQQYFVKIPFVPDPEGGFYDLGFGHLLEHVNATIDTSINQMNDAATLQNAGGGFIGGSIDLGKGKATIRVRPGEYVRITGAGDQLKNSIVPHQHPGPSPVSMKLLELMMSAGKDIASVQDILVGDAQRNQTATTTMALIEQGLKVFTAIYKRIFRALKQEFRLIFEINKKHLDVEKYLRLVDVPQAPPAPQMMGHNGGPPMDPAMMAQMGGGMPPEAMGGQMPPGMPPQPPMPGQGGPMMPPGPPAPPQLPPGFVPPEVVARDYQGQMDIMPVSDPSNITDMQRMAKAQFVMEQIKEGNGYINAKVATRRALEAARIERVDEIIQDPPPPPPDPAQEKAKADMQATQAKAQLDQQSKQADMQVKAQTAQMDLSQKQQEAQMALQQKQAEMQLKERELAIREREMQMTAQLREAEIASKWKALEVKEAELKVAAARPDAD